MAIIFDGRFFAYKKEQELKQEIRRLKKEGVVPKLVSIIVGDNPASVLYINLKRKAAERIGCELMVESFEESVGKDEIIKKIEAFNKDSDIDGIMVQLPLPKKFSNKDRIEIINTIAPGKDVDGLRDDSPFLTPTVRSVVEVIKKATSYPPLKTRPLKVVVVGAKGFEGRKIFRVLKEMGYWVEGVDRGTRDLRLKTKTADILISVTGTPGIIGGKEIKEGAVVIDVGSPKGDVKTQEVLDKAIFISPVPGGVGPLTISCLLENLVESASTSA